MNRRTMLAISLGNIVEWYDFGLFIFFAPVIGEVFFPTTAPSTAAIAAFSVFAVGFLCRPLGGILFGHYGDTCGRAKTLRISILLISLSTLLVGFLPTYHSAGIWAPVLLTLLRLLQGLSVGGEYSGVMICLAESAPKHKRGFMTSFAVTSSNLGFLFALLTLFLAKTTLSDAELHAWGWRLPFIAVGLFGTVILYYRFRVGESPIYLRLKSAHQLEKKPFFAVCKLAPKSLLKIVGLTCMSSTVYMVFVAYMPTYLEQFTTVSSSMAFTIQTILLGCMLFAVPFFAACGDFLGRRRVLIVAASCIILFAIPGFYLLQQPSLFLITLVLSVAMGLSALDQGNSLTAIVETCPAEVRYSGVAFSYNLGNALFGGTAPLVVGLLTHQLSAVAPAYYVIGMALVSLCVIFTLPRRAGDLHTA